jgi:hypothetical protein
MSNRKYAVVAVAAVAMLVAGGLFASNMGFKLNYPIETVGTNGSASGTNTIALPYNQQTNLVMASDLRADINATAGSSVVVSISKLLKSSDSLLAYTGASSATDFALVPGEGYIIQAGGDVNYIIVGSHDPGLAVNLDTVGTNGSASGTSDFAFPYHGTASLASELRDDINAQAGGDAVVSISKFLRTSDALLAYTGSSFATDFQLEPGKSYRIQVSQNVSYIPSHY